MTEGADWLGARCFSFFSSPLSLLSLYLYTAAAGSKLFSSAFKQTVSPALYLLRLRFRLGACTFESPGNRTHAHTHPHTDAHTADVQWNLKKTTCEAQMNLLVHFFCQRQKHCGHKGGGRCLSNPCVHSEQCKCALSSCMSVWEAADCPLKCFC